MTPTPPIRLPPDPDAAMRELLKLTGGKVRCHACNRLTPLGNVDAQGRAWCGCRKGCA